MGTTVDYSVGDTIEYMPFGGGTRQVLVTGKEADVKNGRPGFDGTLTTDSPTEFPTVWGYDSQITRVVIRIIDPA